LRTVPIPAWLKTAFNQWTGAAGLQAGRLFRPVNKGGQSPLKQIQLSLGHASILTTERYLGVWQDLADAPGDRLASNR